MMVGMDDLGLSLSLSSTDHHRNHNHNRHALQMNFMPSSSPSPFSLHNQKSSWGNQQFPTSDGNNSGICRGDTRSFLRGIDVNRMPRTTKIDHEEEEETGVSSPNSTVSSISGKRCERDHEGGGGGEENYEMERVSSRGFILSDEEDGSDPNSRNNKKLRLSKDQSAILEDSFKENNTLNPKQKLALAKQLNLRPRQVEVWFQNRRARTKLKQTEVDCEFLKRCCENLTEENRRLQKEVQELRALKMSPQFYMQMTPPTTLTICPSCERVATSAIDHHQMISGPHNHQRQVAVNNRFSNQNRSITDRPMMLHPL